MKSFIFKLFMLITFLFLSSGDLIAQVSWTKYSGNPVIPAGQNGEWDRHKFMPSILYNADSLRYELWYSASIGPSGGWRPYRIGYATSEDGINWTVRPDPVLTPGATGEWDENTVEAAYVIRENDQYKMWYTSGSGKIGYATSPDGINWTKYNGNPIFEAGTQSWEAGGVYMGCVMPVTGGYKMWYSGWATGVTHESIGYATSTDGIFWQRDTLNNPVIEDGTSGSWDDVGVYLPSVLFIDNLYYLWYGGMGSIVQIGLATSPDGINWSKHPDNPVLRPSSPGNWDDYYVEEGRVIFMDDTLYMWYGASGGFGANYVWQIGLATSPFVPVSVDDNAIQPSEIILSQNYPNPFNPSTKISWQSPVGSQQTLKIYDILGNEVATLVDEYKPAGRYEIEFSASALSSGIYFYRLTAGEFVQTRKMILIK